MSSWLVGVSVAIARDGHGLSSFSNPTYLIISPDTRAYHILSSLCINLGFLSGNLYHRHKTNIVLGAAKFVYLQYSR